MSVSAIVPVYNGATTLARCLAPLVTMQRAGELGEVLVVDDGSSDASAEIARGLGVRALASGGRLGPGGARNVGAREAQGDIVWFVDADVVVHPDAARVLAEVFRATGAAAVFGAYDDEPPAANFLSQYKNLVHHYHHHRHAGESETFWAGCGAVRRDAFLDAGGFDAAAYPTPSIEDIELGARLRERGHAIRLAPELAGTHLKVWRLRNLVHTEIFGRALPWSRLIHARGTVPNTLNVSAGERSRALLAMALFASIVLAAFAVVPAWAALALLVVALLANGELFAMFRRRRGFAFALGATLFHQVYYLYASAAYAWCWIERRLPPAFLRRKVSP